MVRMSRKVNIGVRIRIQGRTLFFFWHCGKKGHLTTECWSNPKNQSSTCATQNKGGKGKSKNATGKGAGSLEQADQAGVVEPQPRPALASTLDLASIEALVRSPHLDQEGLAEMDMWHRCDDFRHFRWMQGLARKRRRMTAATRQLQVSSSPIAEACAYKELLSTGME